MRGLILLLSVVFAFVLVLEFYPHHPAGPGGAPARGVAAPGAGTASVPRVGVGFLERPAAAGAGSPAPAAQASATPSAGPSAVQAAAEASQASTGAPDWLGEIAQPAPETPSWQEPVAEALAHGGADEVARVVGGVAPGDLDDAHRRWVLAFAQALAGDRQQALAAAGEIDAEALTDSQRQLLQRALGAPSDQLVEAGLAPKSSLELAMRLVLRAREGEALLAQKSYAEAARCYSDVLKGDLEAPWPSDPRALARWTEGLDTAQENHRWNPRGNWPSEAITVESGDSLTGIRKRYLAKHPDRLLCVGLIRRANRLDGYIHPGDELRIPTDPASVQVDLSARWVLYFLGDEVAGSWPVGVGRAGQETITGDFVVGQKEEKPVWWPTGSEPIPYGDSRNPLGTHWMPWLRDGRPTSYGFHGTNDPGSIGTGASEGCIRFRNEDVAELFEILPEGAPIHVRE